MSLSLIVRIGTLSIATLVAIAYFIFWDHLPPRSPHKIARIVSGLDLVSQDKVVTYEEDWNQFNGDGHAKIIMELSHERMKKLVPECKSKGYELLSPDLLPNGIDKVFFIGSKSGFFKLSDKESGGSFDLVVLDTENARLIVFVLEL